MATPQVASEIFTSFVQEVEPRLRRGLVAALGVDRGVDATAEALAYAWQHRERVIAMDNPAGYLYRVGQTRAPKSRPVPVDLPAIPPDRTPWIEPGLPAALASLSDTQRVCVLLIHTYEHTFVEVAELLGVSRSTVQKHTDRGLHRLRKALGEPT